MSFDSVKIITAMVTPMNQAGQIDFDNLKTLIEYLLKNGTQAVLVNGTTGEGPTLTHDEKIELIKKTVEIVANRVPVIAGTGSNCTAQTVLFTQEVSKISGVSAALVVVPYYNKPNQRGIFEHFKTVAIQGGMPVFMYNVPSRTGVRMSVNTIIQLANSVDNIIGVKDCTGSINLAKIVEQTDDNFYVYSGEDELALDAKIMGARGIVSVLSHIRGNELLKMYNLLEKGEVEKSSAIMRKLIPQGQALFSYPSPAPVKAALNRLGIKVGGTRLPIIPLNDDERKEVFNKLQI